MRLFVFAFLLLLLCGCSTFNGSTAHYNLVTTEGTEVVLPPPSKADYNTDVYSNPDLPYLQDLKNYREYIDRKIAQVEARNGVSRKPASAPRPQLRLPVAIEPKFRPRDPGDQDVLLEDALEYASELRDFHRAYVKELSQQLTPPPAFDERSNL